MKGVNQGSKRHMPRSIQRGQSTADIGGNPTAIRAGAPQPTTSKSGKSMESRFPAGVNKNTTSTGTIASKVKTPNSFKSGPSPARKSQNANPTKSQLLTKKPSSVRSNMNVIAEEDDGDITFPIDFVYTWVDGSDEVWQQSRLRYQTSQSNIPED